MERHNKRNNIDKQFKRLKKSLQAVYNNKCGTINPLPWRKELSLSLDETFIERQGHLVVKEKLSWKAHDQWIDVDAVTLMALSFHYCQNSSRSIITVEGKMGSGKTTLCNRILKDWASESLDIMDGICPLYINITDSKYEECIKEKDLSALFNIPTNMDKTQICNILQQKQEEILVFVDINKTQTSLDWLDTICNELLPKAKYIILCRPDMLYKVLDMSSVRIILQDFDNDKINKMLDNLSVDYYIQDDIVDSMNEDESLIRLCSNPFLCTAFMITCKEQYGVKCTDNTVKYIRLFIGFIWKRFVCESRVILEDLDILMTSLSGVFIDIFENGGYLCESDIHNIEHGRLLLESGLLHQETYNPEFNTNILCYSFFDIIINEYACALHFSQTLLRAPGERRIIGTILRNPKWHTICRMTASILKENAYLVTDEILQSDTVKMEQLKLLCECVHESGCLNISNDQLKNKRNLFEDRLDLGEVDVSLSTLKGLKNIVMQLQNTKDFDVSTGHCFPSNQNINRLYKSCNDIFSVMTTDDSRCEMCTRYGNSFICKRCQLTNMQKKRQNIQRNRIMNDIETKMKRNTTKKLRGLTNNLNKYSRSLLDLSLSPKGITRDLSLLCLDDVNNTVNARKTHSSALKELTLKGSCVANRTMEEVINLINTCHVQRLYMMADTVNPGQPLSNKLVDNFVMCACANLTHLSLNDYHLGEGWMRRLCGIIQEKSMLQSIRISVSCIHELSVESAISLVKSVKTNILIENVELFCGVQPMVIITLFNFYEELLAKDDRLHLVFL